MALALQFDSSQDYQRILELQETLVDARYREEIPDVLLILEHQPVITLGRRGRENFLLQTPEELEKQGIPVLRSSRGGDVTWHGPGQTVLYPIINLSQPGRSARRHLEVLEDTAIACCEHVGVAAFRRGAGKEGAWTDQGKIAAIGLKFRRWVSYHGLSFNGSPDLSGFQHIVPCGLEGEAVTSLKAILGARCPDSTTLAKTLCQSFFRALEAPAPTIIDVPDHWTLASVRTLIGQG